MQKYGVITGTSIYSPQSIIVASACYLLDLNCTCIFGGTTFERLNELKLTNVLTKLGANIEIPCKTGRTNVLQSYINSRIAVTNEFCVKYGINIMNPDILRDSVAQQIYNIPNIKNFCMVCGSGITTIGVLYGLNEYCPDIENIYLFGTAPNRQKMINSHFANLLTNYNPYVSKIHYIDLHSEKGFVYEHPCASGIDDVTFHPQYEAKAFERMKSLDLNNNESCFYIIGQEIVKEWNTVE